MKKRIISMMLVALSLALVGCDKESKLTDDKVAISSNKKVSEDGNYVVVVELGEGVKKVDYTLTENGQLVSSKEDIDEGLKENIMSNKANGEYEYVLTVKDDDGNTVTKDLVVKVDNSMAVSAKVSSNDDLVEWSGDRVNYVKDDIVEYGDKKFTCLQGHTSQDDWTPESAASLWKEVKK